MPTLGQPEAYLQVKDGFFDEAGNIANAETRKFVHGWMDKYVAWVKRFTHLTPNLPDFGQIYKCRCRLFVAERRDGNAKTLSPGPGGTALPAETHACGGPRAFPKPRRCIARLLAPCKTLGGRGARHGIAFRLQGTTETAAVFTFTCVLHLPAAAAVLTTAEQAVAEQLCEGRTLAQIARLRGVSPNTVKSQVRQIFRKLNVESRVALVRRLCPDSLFTAARQRRRRP